MKKQNLLLIAVAGWMSLSGSLSLGRASTQIRSVSSLQQEKLSAFAELNGPNLLTPVFCEPPIEDESPFEAFYFDRDGKPCSSEICDHALYRCKKVVSDPVEYETKVAEDIELDCAGKPLRHVALVLGGQGLQVRHNENICLGENGENISQTPSGVLLTFSGSGGDSWRDTKAVGGTNGGYAGRDPDNNNSATDGDYRALERRGIRVVASK